jgi:CheY-like chemotaxis protein
MREIQFARTSDLACGVHRAPSMPNSDTATARMTVLVADDDDDMRALVAETFRSDGYAVIEARDGAELLDHLDHAFDDPRALPDVIVTDVMMPNRSGLGVLESLRRARMHLPVILITRLADDSVHTLARRLGAVGVLHKPFDVDDLRTAVMNAVVAYDKVRTPTRM